LINIWLNGYKFATLKNAGLEEYLRGFEIRENIIALLKREGVL
jgi:hypothetical protein